APDDAVARAVEARERAAEALGLWQQIFFRHESTIEHDFAGDGGAQGELAFDGVGGKPLRATFYEKAADLAVKLRPDQGEVGDGRIRYPHLGAGETVAVGDLLRARHH